MTNEIKPFDFVLGEPVSKMSTDPSDDAEAIHPASPDDAETIRYIMDQIMLCIQDQTWFVDDSVDYIRRQIEADEGYILKYMVGHQMAGYLTIHFPGDEEDHLASFTDLERSEWKRAAYIDSVCVLPEYRGRGIFASLLSRAIREEINNGMHVHLFSTIHPDNNYSRRILEQAGFSPVASVLRYGGLPRLVMYRKLQGDF